MKSTIISMVIVLCVLAIIPALLIGDKSLLDRFGLSLFGSAGEELKTPENLTSVTTNVKVQVYRWRDEHGVMQFTSTPPDTQQAEIVELSPNTNIIQAVEVPAEEATEEKRGGPRVMTLGNPYSPGGMRDLLDSTSTMAEDMAVKQQEQQQLMDQILGIKK